MNVTRRASLIAVPAIALAGCAQVTAAEKAVTSAVGKIAVALADAKTFWGVVKGVALVASVADPALAIPIASAITAVDEALAAASSDETLVASVVSQGVALLNLSASAIKVVPSA